MVLTILTDSMELGTKAFCIDGVGGVLEEGVRVRQVDLGEVRHGVASERMAGRLEHVSPHPAHQSR